MKRPKRLTRNQRKRAAQEDLASERMEQLLLEVRKVSFDFETTTITGRVSSSQPSLLSWPRARSILDEFENNHPDMVEFFRTYEPDYPRPRKTGARLNSVLLAARYDEAETRALAFIKESPQASFHPEFLQELLFDDEDLDLGQRAVEATQRAITEATRGLVGRCAHGVAPQADQGSRELRSDERRLGK